MEETIPMTSTVSMSAGQVKGSEAVPSRGLTATEAEAIEPRGADVLANCSPFDRRVVEQAIDQFLEQLGDLNLGSPGFRWAAGMMTGAIVMGVAVSTAEALRRRSRNPGSEVSEPTEGEEGMVFPGLPGLRQPWALEA